MNDIPANNDKMDLEHRIERIIQRVSLNQHTANDVEMLKSVFRLYLQSHRELEKIKKIVWGNDG